MPNQNEQSRRDFIKLAAAGATTLAIGNIEVSAETAQRAGWVNGQRINPAIPNTLVVYCTDPSMIKSNVTNFTFANQNSAVDTAKVEANMDKLAMRLTGKTSAAEAWKTIFMKPAAKPDFSTVKAAIKVNCINTRNMPRIAIVGKVCKELMNLGMPAGNITIYDSSRTASGNDKYPPFINNGLPQGVVITSKVNDGTTVPVGSNNYRCSPAIAISGANGIEYVADILVNCAVNKGHSSGHGSFTLTMKNHTGTLKYSCPTAADMIDENKCEAVIGTMGDPAKPPRQQLCIVDSLWAATGGPGGDPTHSPANIAMTTVAPVIDYAVAENIRKKIMNAGYTATVVNNWLTSFGIDKAQIQWVDALAPVAAFETSQARIGPRVLNVRVQGREASTASFNLPENPGRIRIEILTPDGKLAHRLEPSGDAAGMLAVWDGRLKGGAPAPAGQYIVRLRYGAETVTGRISLL